MTIHDNMHYFDARIYKLIQFGV